jgi:hypothetical protein
MAFLTSAQFIKNFDTRRVQQLLSDTGTPVAAGDLATNTNLLELLAEATELVLSSVQVRNQYTEAELQALADSATKGFLLRRLVSDLAFGLLVSRRGSSAADLDRLAPNWKTAQVQLARLAAGELIFPRLADADIGGSDHLLAGTPRCTDLQTQTTTPISSWVREAARIHPRDQNTSSYGAS